MCTEMLWGKLSLPFPPLPELCPVPRWWWWDARPLQARHRPGWLRLPQGKLFQVSPELSLRKHTQQGILPSTLQRHSEPVFPTRRAEWSSAFISENWNWGPPASLRQVTGLVLSLETQALTRRWDPHILAPASANALITDSKQKISAGETMTPNPRTPPGQQFYHSLHLLKSVRKINFLNLKTILVLLNSALLLLCNSNLSFPRTKMFHFILQLFI